MSACKQLITRSTQAPRVHHSNQSETGRHLTRRDTASPDTMNQGHMSDGGETRSTNNCSGFSRAPAPPSAAGGPTRVRRKPLPSKGHKKSRKGCLTCRSRRVKCSEIFPECGSCARLHLLCEWPDPIKATLAATQHAEQDVVLSSTATEANKTGNVAQRTSSPVSLSTPLRSTPGVLSMEDLRLFHHFLFHAYPPLPLGGVDIWRSVGAMSHEASIIRHFHTPTTMSSRMHLVRRVSLQLITKTSCVNS